MTVGTVSRRIGEDHGGHLVQGFSYFFVPRSTFKTFFLYDPLIG